MTTFITGTSASEVLLADGETTVVTAGASLIGALGLVSYDPLSEAEVVVEGEIASGEGGILLLGTAESVGVLVSAGGSITTSVSGSAAIGMSDVRDSKIVNEGVVSGETFGIAFLDVDGALVIGNSGTIEVLDGASAIYGVPAFAAPPSSGVTQIVNSGTITGGGSIFVIAGLMPVAAIDVAGGIELANSGAIIGLASNSAPGVDAYAISVFNTESVDGADVDTVSNTGLIDGAVRLGGGADELSNFGTMIGRIEMGEGDDFVLNEDLIDGDLDLGAGFDTYVAYGGGSVAGSVLGMEGNDSLTGGDTADRFLGGDDTDRLHGRGGKDLLDGGEDSDVVRGGASSDVIIGGGDGDTLTGGGGDDAFVYLAASDSEVGARDRITDFETGDLIDLSALLPVELSFVGEDAFKGGGIGSVRFTELGGDTRVLVDVDGDGVTDMRIDLMGVQGVTEDDFLL